MAVNREAYIQLQNELNKKGVTLVAVSKNKPVEDILELYDLGHRDFGENYVQELIDKISQLPPDIRWHFIGHLQTNKVKLIISHVQLIHGVDSLKLLKEINKQSEKINMITDCLLQVHIASEETKFGLDETELDLITRDLDSLKGVNVVGLMGMASFSDNQELVRSEFRRLKTLFEKYRNLDKVKYKGQTLSSGMSADYRIAIEEGSTMVRIGSLIFGERS
jgi:PLP dependent protein